MYIFIFSSKILLFETNKLIGHERSSSHPLASSLPLCLLLLMFLLYEHFCSHLFIIERIIVITTDRITHKKTIPILVIIDRIIAMASICQYSYSHYCHGLNSQ